MHKNFLAKKSWHTGSLKHMEKVWKAEQHHEEEDRKVRELKRELEEEQKIYDLKRLQESVSGKPTTERLEWMYVVRKGPTPEDYLLGNASASSLTSTDEQKELEALRTGSQPGALWLQDSANPTQDAANKVRDDPLLEIRRSEQRSLKEILSNPVQMKKIKKSKEMQELLKKLKKMDKKEKKERKETKVKSVESHKTSKRHEEKEYRRIESEPKRSRISSRNDYNSLHLNRFQEVQTNRRVQKLSEEEKQRRLAEMIQDGQFHEEQRWKRLKHAEEQEQKEEKTDIRKSKTFLDDVNKSVYTEHNENLEDRVKRNIYYIQRNNEDLE